MARVIGLQPREGIRLDAARLAGMVSDLGHGQAHAHAERTLQEMDRALFRIGRHYTAGEISPIGRIAQTLARRATGLGMTTLAAVALDVSDCARRGDMIAFAATWTRLQRIAARSDLDGSPPGSVRG